MWASKKIHQELQMLLALVLILEQKPDFTIMDDPQSQAH